MYVPTVDASYIPSVELTSGNVGIGTTGPTSALEVKGNVEFNENQFFIDDSTGNVGVGTTAPAAKLHVAAAHPSLKIGNAIAEDTSIIYDGNAEDFYIALDDGTDDLYIGSGATVGSNIHLAITNDRFVGIGITNPAAELHIGGTTPQITIGDKGAEDTTLFYDGNATDFYIALDDGTDDLYIGSGTTVGSNVHITVDTNGNVGIGFTAPVYPLQIACSSTTWTDRGSTISCSDYAEVYEHSANEEELEAGMVLVIDEENEGKVKVSTKAYDRFVIGVVSGSPGMLIGNTQTIGLGGISADNLKEGSLPMALSGKVYVQVVGDVKPGDFLTTSIEQGKAMACDDFEKCQGAIIGKAMANDKDGEVMTIISLQ